MVLESSMGTFALSQRQRSDWGLRVTKNAYFSLIIHTKHLLLVTFCDLTAGTGVSFRTDAQMAAEEQTDVEVETVI